MADQYLTSGQIHFTGLGSGTDFDSIIKKLVEVERTHINRLESWKEEWEEKVASFQDLNSKMLALETTLSGMDTTDEFLIKSVASTDEDVLTATADSDALEGTHSIVINQLAQNDIWTHTAGESDTTSDITGATASQFDYTYNGESISVAVASGTSLSGLRDLINKDADNPGVRASIINDGTNYHLQLRGLDLGDDYDITIDGTTTLSGYSSADFEHSQDDQNSEIRVDGYPSASWIERSTNSIDDVITGVTLNLKDTTASVQITVSTDTDAVTEQVQTFVSQTNEVLSLMSDLMEFDESTEKGAILMGNYGVQIIQQKLKSILASKGLGFDYDRDDVVSLGSVGITTDAEEGSPTLGQLLFDESAFRDALSSNTEVVAQLFAADFVPETDTSDFIPYDEPYISGVTDPGSYSVTYDVDGSGNISNAFIDGQAASVDNTLHTITSDSGASRGLAAEVKNLNSGSYSGTYYLKQGKSGELIDEIDQLTNGSTGTLHILEKNYLNITENIDEKIADEEERIARLERDLRNRYARLEALLGYYDQLNTYLTSQIAQLPSGSSGS